METAAPVSIRKRALETLSMIKNKLWLGDWVAGEKMGCKCEDGGEAVTRGQGAVLISERGRQSIRGNSKAVVDHAAVIEETIPIEGSVVVVFGAVR